MAFTLDKFSLQGKVAIVTGAGGRKHSIGEAYCFGLAAAGATVIAADINEAGAKDLASRLTEAGYKAIGAQVNIVDQASIDALVKLVADQFGGADILVNNAALMAELKYEAGVMGADNAEWDRVMNVNLKGAWLMARAFAPQMIARGGGKIVNQVSAGAFPAQSLYGIAKLATVGLTTTLARELGGQKINVNAIAPGNTMSEAGAALTPEGSAYHEMVKAMCTVNPFGQPDDLVGALLLLVSPAGEWMSGQVLHVDGGLILRP
ncbi:MAG: SDR family oxidoreductase [Ectothiorhodospiraceae bacterium]|jgi:NAD(P)-dependent dehydrogenase (short-subunit alcohol dehydrogenase family)|nr:SDR family oxidoreductase [Ectothiorhodospiraceae bacterium]